MADETIRPVDLARADPARRAVLLGGGLAAGAVLAGAAAPLPGHTDDRLALNGQARRRW